jgi:uncharacterized membrane protein
MQENTQTEKEIHEIFDISLLLKGIHALVEIIGGLVFLFISRTTITSFVNFFIRDEVIEAPSNHILNYILHATQHFTGSSKLFAVVYLISHGIINAFIVIALWKEKLWAYPVSITILGIFGIYQLYRYSFNHSLWLLSLTVLDVIVIFLVWHEYGIVKKRYTK